MNRCFPGSISKEMFVLNDHHFLIKLLTSSEARISLAFSQLALHFHFSSVKGPNNEKFSLKFLEDFGKLKKRRKFSEMYAMRQFRYVYLWLFTIRKLPNRDKIKVEIRVVTHFSCVLLNAYGLNTFCKFEKRS